MQLKLRKRRGWRNETDPWLLHRLYLKRCDHCKHLSRGGKSFQKAFTEEKILSNVRGREYETFLWEKYRGFLLLIGKQKIPSFFFQFS